MMLDEGDQGVKPIDMERQVIKLSDVLKEVDDDLESINDGLAAAALL